MISIDLANMKARKIIDARACSDSGSLFEAKKGMGAVKIGDILEVWSGDSATKVDFSNWAQKVGHEYLAFLIAEGFDRIFVKRRK